MREIYVVSLERVKVKKIGVSKIRVSPIFGDTERHSTRSMTLRDASRHAPCHSETHSETLHVAPRHNPRHSETLRDTIRDTSHRLHRQNFHLRSTCTYPMATSWPWYCILNMLYYGSGCHAQSQNNRQYPTQFSMPIPIMQVVAVESKMFWSYALWLPQTQNAGQHITLLIIISCGDL